jgi:protein-disulfide isomerase
VSAGDHSLTSAPVPALGPDDRVRGDGPEAILYLDLGCPHCAATWARIRSLPLRLAFRHFPVASKHPRAPALHAAAEAAAAQRPEAFWELVDSIYIDQGHVDVPHLWERARGLGLDLERFNRDRRSDGVAARVRRDFQDGIRAGVTGTPAAFAEGRHLAVEVAGELERLAAGAEPIEGGLVTSPSFENESSE